MSYVIINSCCRNVMYMSKETLFIGRLNYEIRNKSINFCANYDNIMRMRLCYSMRHRNYLGEEICPKKSLGTLKIKRLLPISNHTLSSASYLRNSLMPLSSWHLNVRHFSNESVASKGAFYEAFYNSPPVLFAQECLLYFHDMSGLPWWATIVVSTFLLRATITFPLALYQNYILAKVENIQLELKETSKEMGRETSIAVRRFNWTEKQAKAMYIHSMKKQWKKMIERDNCHPAKAGLLVLIQVPMWVSLSLGIRNLVYLFPVPDVAAKVTLLELSGGGLSWFHNLTVPDTTWILPIIMGLTNLAIIELQDLSKVKADSRFQKYITNFFRGVSVIMVPIAASVPSCLCLYWATSSAVGLMQNLIQLSPRVRRICHIPETASVSKQPYKHIYEKLSARFGAPSPPQPPTTS